MNTDAMIDFQFIFLLPERQIRSAMYCHYVCYILFDGILFHLNLISFIR